MRNNLDSEIVKFSSKLRILFFSSFLLLISSCTDKNIIFDESHEIVSMNWNMEDTIAFQFDIEDTNQYLDFYLNLRTTTSYNWANCYIFVQLESPKLVAYDTLHIPLADVAGNWYGKVSGSMVENNVLFMKNVKLHEIGKYKLSFVQGMREDNLSEISDVGLTLKKATK